MARKRNGRSATTPGSALALHRASSAEQPTSAGGKPLRLTDATCASWRTLGGFVMAESARRARRMLRLNDDEAQS